MGRLPESVYQERRRIVSAIALTVMATVGDVSAENGTGLPVLSSLGFFFVLTTGPLVLGRVLDFIANTRDDHDYIYDQDKEPTDK